MPKSAAQTTPVRFSLPSLPFFFGLLDGGSGLSYLLHISILPWYVAIVLTKIGAVILLRPRLRLPDKVGSAMAAGAAILIFSSVFESDSTEQGITAAGGFLVQLLLTLAVIRSSQIIRYARGAACIIGITAGLHLVGVLTHQMSSLWGRYSFFGNSEPNLGCEIEAAGAIAAALALPRAQAAVLVFLFIIDTNLMQGRSALMTEGMALAVIFSFDRQRKLRSRRALILLGVVVVGILAGLLTGADQWIQRQVEQLFFVTDQTRGVASGFSGRAALWNVALSLFEQSPLIGHGLGSYERIGFVGPHNIILYGLGEDGLASTVFLGAIVYGFVECARRSTFSTAVLLCAVPLFAFNDRFINLNPYPFVICIFLSAVATSARPRPRHVSAAINVVFAKHMTYRTVRLPTGG